MTAAPIWHGGDLDEARDMFPHAPQPWIDLSTGINPVPYPLATLPISSFHLLPSPGDVTALEAVAARAYRVDANAHVVAAPGTQALLELLPRLYAPGQVAVLGPTYAEHAICWRKAKHDVHMVQGLEETSEPDVLVVVNPNNPDGRRTSANRLQEVAQNLAAHGGLLVVDEAFADFEPENSLAPCLPENAVVLRSFGKAYGLAGVRLGFLVCGLELARQVRARLGPWAVSGPALAAGRQALEDDHWLQAEGAARAQDALRLDQLMEPMMGATIGGTFLFRSFRAPQARQVFETLGRAGIFVRRFSYDSSLLRVGLPGDEGQWVRLERVLQGRA